MNKIKASTIIIAIAYLSLLSNTIYADENEFPDDETGLADFYGDEDFVSIATGAKQLISKAPAVASIITAKQIKQMGALTVAEILETVPGLHVYPSPFNRLNTSFSIRGIHTDQNPQILFLVNGLPVREEYTGARPQTLKMPVHSIARIEVIRGPGSAVYGADAYAGVINIITDITNDEPELGLTYGSFDFQNILYKERFNIKDTKVGVSLETIASNGDKDRVMSRDIQSVFDQLFGSNASKAPGSLNTQYDVMDFRVSTESKNWSSNFWFWKNKNAGQGAGAAQALDPTGVQNTSIYEFDIQYETQLSSWLSTIRYSFYHLKDRAEFSVLPAGAILPLGSDGNLNLANPVGLAHFKDGYLGNPQPTEKLHALDYSLLSNSIDNHQVRIAFGISERRLTAKEQKNFGPGVVDIEELERLFANNEIMSIDGTITDVSNTPYVFVKNSVRRNRYISIQDQWQFANDWELTSGIRYDHYNDFGSTINPRLALVWETSQNTSSKFLYGRAFRAPSFDTLYAINNPVGIGNPNLKPEIIDTLEYSFNHKLTNDMNWVFNLFHYDGKDIIEFVPDPGETTTTAQNIREQQGYGVEIEYTWHGDNFDLNANYSWQNSEDKETKTKVPLAPQSLFGIYYHQKFYNRLSLSSKLNWVGKREREASDTRPTLNKFFIMDLNINYILDEKEKWQVSLSTKNLFDKKAYEPSHPGVPPALGPIDDYPIEGRSFYLTLSASW